MALFFSDNPPTPRYDIARYTPAVQLATHGVQGDVCRAHQRRTSTEPRGATKPFLLLPTEARGHAPLQPGIFVDQNDLAMRTDSRFSTVAMSIALALAGPSLLSRDLSALAMPHVDGSAAVPLMSAEPLMLGTAALPSAAAIRRPRVVVKVPITPELAAASANYSNTTTRTQGVRVRTRKRRLH